MIASTSSAFHFPYAFQSNGIATRVSSERYSSNAAADTENVKKDIKTYIKCSKCTATYQIEKDQLGNSKGRRVSCGVCGHAWFQSNDKLFTLDSETAEFVPYQKDEAEKVKKNLQAVRGARNDPSVFTGESKLYVGNLSYAVTEGDLIWFFSENAGDVGDVSIICDRETGRSRGFAFITMLSEEGGEKGVEMDGMEFLGRNLQVRKPNTQ